MSELYSNPENDQGIAWLLRSNEFTGSAFLLGHHHFLNNEGLQEDQNRRFAKNLFEHFVAPHERIIFADYHHGLSNLYDADALLADTRFQLSCLVLLLLWFAYVVLHNVRLGPVRRSRTALSNREFANATGRLYARHTDDDEVNLQLLRAFNNAYRKRHRLPRNGRSVLEHMRTNTLFARADIAGLHQVEQNPDLNPMKTQNVLHSLYRRLETL